MKNFKHSIITVALALCMCACADLDMPNDGRITYNEMFSSYLLINNYYRSCISIPAIEFTYWESPLASLCDEAHDASDMTSGGIYDWYHDRWTPTYNLLYVWESYYTQIGKCNTFLQYIADPDLSYQFANPDEKDGMIAEVRVARAYYYLLLAKRYGGVPIVDTPYELDHDFSKDRRATFEEVADFIIAECDLALATKETEGSSVGFRWAISDEERGKITRAFAYAVKSQTALFAASPLWFTSNSKYTWEKATEITKEALDQCLAHGFQLYDTPVDPNVAQNSYAYYFITRSDGSRSWDKETIHESSLNSPVWQLAGLPVTTGVSKAGAGPSQELVDSYEMLATGEPPVLGYSDANRLQPILNSLATDYFPNKPYEGRDPRFYASIYYNGAPKVLNVFENIPLDMGVVVSELDVTPHNNYWEFVTHPAAGMPFYMIGISGSCRGAAKCTFSFEYQLINDLTAQFILQDNSWNWILNVPGVSFQGSNAIDPNNEALWKPFSYDLMPGIRNGWGNMEDRIFINFTMPGMRMLIRNFKIVSEASSAPVETFVGGNCGISTSATDIRFTRTGYYMRKFNNYKSNNTLNADGHMRTFRLAELYLNFAEAAYHLAGGPDVPVASAAGIALSARDAVNAVRKRAGMPDFPTGMTQEAFEKKYRNERRVELAFEEHRFFDVRRWKILNQTDGFVTGMRITRSGPDLIYTRIKLADRGTNADKYLMFPLSAAEVQKMEALTGEKWQNPGW